MKKNKLQLDKGDAHIYVTLKNGIIKVYHGEGVILKNGAMPLFKSFAYQGNWEDAINILQGGRKVNRRAIMMTKFFDIMENWLTPFLILFAVFYFTLHFIIL